MQIPPITVAINDLLSTQVLTKAYQIAKSKLTDLLISQPGAVQFRSSYPYRKYGLKRVGMNAVIVPGNKGILKSLSGRKVLLVCIGSGDRDVRNFIAVPINGPRQPKAMPMLSDHNRSLMRELARKGSATAKMFPKK